MKLEITDTDNAAFTDPDSGEPNERFYRNEVIRILEDVVIKIQDGYDGGRLRDINGNTVGDWSL